MTIMQACRHGGQLWYDDAMNLMNKSQQWWCHEYIEGTQAYMETCDDAIIMMTKNSKDNVT